MVHTSAFILRVATIAFSVAPTLATPIPWEFNELKTGQLFARGEPIPFFGHSDQNLSGSETGSTSPIPFQTPFQSRFHTSTENAHQDPPHTFSTDASGLHTHMATSSMPALSDPRGPTSGNPNLSNNLHTAQHIVELHGTDHVGSPQMPAQGGSSSSFASGRNVQFAYTNGGPPTDSPRWHGSPLVIPPYSLAHNTPQSPPHSSGITHFAELQSSSLHSSVPSSPNSVSSSPYYSLAGSPHSPGHNSW